MISGFVVFFNISLFGLQSFFFAHCQPLLKFRLFFFIIIIIHLIQFFFCFLCPFVNDCHINISGISIIWTISTWKWPSSIFSLAWTFSSISELFLRHWNFKFFPGHSEDFHKINAIVFLGFFLPSFKTFCERNNSFIVILGENEWCIFIIGFIHGSVVSI